MQIKGFRLPFLSPQVPTKKAQNVDTTALTPTIQETMAGSGAILSYTKLLNHEFSMFQQICPVMPRTQIKTQFLRLMFFITISICTLAGAYS